MRQNRTSRPRSSLVRLILVMVLLLLLQPMAGCAEDPAAATPPMRSGDTTSAAGTGQAGAGSAAPTAIAATSQLAQPADLATGPASTTAMSATTATPSTQPAVPTVTEPAVTVPTPTASPTASPTPTPRPTAKPTPKPTQPATSPYYLYCELGSYTLQVYGKDASGNYTVPVRRIRTAIGRGSMTPRGKFRLGTRERWHTFGSTTYAQYAVKYHSSGLYLHSPLYSAKDIRKLQAWSYTAIGTKNTSGCLRMTTGDIYWIYRNCPSGTVLEIVGGSPRGLTPPALPKLVRSNEDPTDPQLS